LPEFSTEFVGLITATIGDVQKAVKQYNVQQDRASQVSQPVLAGVVKSVTANANGLAICSLGAPTQGRKRMIYAIRVSGPDPSQTVAGSAYIYALSSGASAMLNSGTTNLLQVFGMTGWKDYTSKIPNVAFYSTNQLILHNNESLIVVFTGCTSGTEYVANCDFMEWQEGAVQQGFIV
jgi:hypothetical protein